MQVYLVVVGGPLSGRRMVIRPPSTLTVGRTENADFAVPGDKRMSSVHLQLECDHHSCRVHDLDSANGILVNGQPVKHQSLTNGDRIAAGATTFRIHIEGATPPVEPPTEPSLDKTEPTEIAETKTVFSRSRVTSGLPSGQALPDVPDQVDSNTGSQRFVGAVLEITSGKHVGRKIWVRKTQSVRIGSAETADQTIDDRRLSANHFMVEFGQAGWQIRDLNSSNGTYVNGQRVTLAALDDGDRILAGATAFVARLGDDDLQGMESSTLSFEAALADEDPLMRREALYAALWTRQPWLLDYCRQKAAEPGPENIDELQLLAVLGTSSDLPLIRKIGETAELGETRYEILASYGHPKLMDDILSGIDSKDPETAGSAAAAFARITGLEVDYVEGEDDAALPDTQKAHWEDVKDKYSRGTRWCCGHDLSKGATDAIVSELDMLTRWELRLRGKNNGTWQGNLADLERFPISD